MTWNQGSPPGGPAYRDRVFERFTDRARRVVVLAQEEARLLNHNSIGTEHILLGLVREQEGVAAIALQSLGIALDDVRRNVLEIVGEAGAAPTGHIPFTPRAKKVLEMSLREGLQLGHNYIGTEHILLGLIREGEGAAAKVLQHLGADLDRVRQTVIQLLSGHTGGAATASGETAAAGGSIHETVADEAMVTEQDHPVCPSCFASVEEHARVRRLQIDGDESRSVEVLYCGRCGVTLGVVPP
jgi:ATP-dependent Clp protease ATP-binding subunit ClpC